MMIKPATLCTTGLTLLLFSCKSPVHTFLVKSEFMPNVSWAGKYNTIPCPAGHHLTILWDRTGEKYGKGRGLRIYADGKLVAKSSKIKLLAVSW